MGRKLIAFLAFALFCVLVSASSSPDFVAKDKDVIKGKYKSSNKNPSYYDGNKYDKDDDDDDKYDKDDDDDDKYDKDDDDDDKYDKDDDDDDKYDKDDDDDDKYDKDDKKDDGKYKKKDEVYKKLYPSSRTYQKEKKKYYSAKKCMFKFCDGKGVIVVGRKNDRAVTSAICSKKYDVKIGSVDETGEAIHAKYRLRISNWRPLLLKQGFSPSFFKAYTKYGKNRSGVGHEVAQQNQAKFLHRKCWILPLKAYQVWSKKTGGWVEKYGKKPYVDCISFCTVVPKKYRKY